MGSMIYTYQRSKLTKKQRAKREAILKEQRAIKKSLEDRYKGTTLKTSDNWARAAEESRRHREMYPSLNSGSLGDCAKREPQKYTGDLIIGIATMHKSNAVPVLKKEDAEEISKMRR